MVRVHATVLGLALAGGTRHRTWLPILLANAAVGLAYMHLEREAIRTERGWFHTRRLPPLTYAQNAAVNLGLHAFATAWAARRAREGTPVLPWAVALAEVAGLTLLDLEALYPARALLPYKLAHAGAVATLAYALR